MTASERAADSVGVRDGSWVGDGSGRVTVGGGSVGGGSVGVGGTDVGGAGVSEGTTEGVGWEVENRLQPPANVKRMINKIQEYRLFINTYTLPEPG
jgi:hypothetical protein